MEYPSKVLIVYFLEVCEDLNSFKIQRSSRKKSGFLVIAIHTHENS